MLDSGRVAPGDDHEAHDSIKTAKETETGSDAGTVSV
jgi:hypothetical protein